MMAGLIRIIAADRHFAQNGPTGIRINTGTRYFAAVLLQEWYEFTRYLIWFWGVPVLFWSAALAGWLAGVDPDHVTALAGAGVLFMLCVTLRLLPWNLAERELTGQAIEIAAIRLFYQRPNMHGEYRVQARSMIRSDSPYVAKGYWPDVERVDPALYSNEDAKAGVIHPGIEHMVAMLKARQPFAEAYVRKHWAWLQKWRPLGAESHGY